jgi:hypothetical protein
VFNNISKNLLIKYKDINSVSSFTVTTFIGLSCLFYLTECLGKDRDYLIAFSFLLLNVLYIHKDGILKKIVNSIGREEINTFVSDAPTINHYFELCKKYKNILIIPALSVILFYAYYAYYKYCVRHIVHYDISLVLLVIFSGFTLFLLQKGCFFTSKKEDRQIIITKKLLYIALCGLIIYFIDSLPLHEAAYEGLEHHWAYFIEPLNSIKEGGILYWSIPYQYGFLNGVFLDIFSFGNPQKTLFVFLLISYLVFYAITLSTAYKLSIKHFSSVALGFFVLLFFIPGWITDGTFPLTYPSVTVFRFIGPTISYMIFRYLLIAKVEKFKYLIISSIPIILSFLSFEIFMMILMMKLSLLSLSFQESKQKAWDLILKDLILYLVVISFIYITYGINYGVIIDPYSFIEYVLTYKENIRMTYVGNFMLFYLVLTYSFWLYKKSSNGLVYLNTIFMFSVGSYFILRSHDNNFLNIAPLIGFALLNNCIDTKGKYFSELFYKKFIWVLFFVAALANPAFSKLLDFHVWQEKKSENSTIKSYVESYQAPIIYLSLDISKKDINNLSFLDLSSNFTPKLLLNGNTIKPSTLNLPFSHFNLLPDWRKSIYLNRMIQSKVLTENLLLIKEKKEHPIEIPEILKKYYVVFSATLHKDKIIILLKKHSN